MLSFYLIGVSLWTIKKNKLYRQSHRTFENYVSDRWQLKKSQAYHLVSAAKVYNNLSTIVDENAPAVLPQNEQQIRWLSPLPPNVQRLVWEKAVTICEGEQPTGKVVKNLVDTITSKAKSLITQSAKVIRNESTRRKNEERIRAILDQSDNAKESLSGLGKFSVILADPPWRYDHSVSDDKAIENHYPTMTVEEIAELPVPDICTESAVLYLWVTNPKLKDGLYILDRWGFDYRTNICWLKEFNGLGIGYWARSRHELLLIGTKGDIPCPAPNVRPESVILSKRKRHSQKPDDIFKIIETAYPTLPKCELFSRKKRNGWKCWGNEIL